MRKTKEILRQKWALGRSHRAIAASVGVSAGVVSTAQERATSAGLTTWRDVEPLGEEELERRLYPSVGIRAAVQAHEPDCEWIHRERRRKGVTPELLNQAYLEQHPSGLHYTAFRERYRTWLGIERAPQLVHDRVPCSAAPRARDDLVAIAAIVGWAELGADRMKPWALATRSS